MIKPDAVSRGLTGEIIRRIEKKGLKIVALKMIRVDKATAEKHYAEHKGKPFYSGLVSFITSAPVIAGVVEGKEAVKVLRKLIGKTDPKEADLGTIRGDLAIDVGLNCVHASDSLESAKREISLYFKPEEILSYERCEEEWVYEER